jgi:hypothetical protein
MAHFTHARHAEHYLNSWRAWRTWRAWSKKGTFRDSSAARLAFREMFLLLQPFRLNKKK